MGIPFRLPLSWMPTSRLPTTPARSSRPLRLRSWCGRWFRRRSAVSAPQSSKTSRFPAPAGHGRRRVLVNRARGTWTSIAENSTLEYSKVCEEWFPKVSWNAYKNDPQRNPPKTIDVEFVCDMDSERTEIWRRLDTGGYLMRKLCNEPFARWLVCRERQGWWEDGACVRPNITFRHRKQTEKVRYDDWNETAAYSDTFNPNFREG